MDMITIDKNIPMPKGGRPQPRIYPFAEMDVGDSFALPVPKNGDPVKFAAKIRALAWMWRKHKSVKFSVLLVEEGAKVRVWRTE